MALIYGIRHGQAQFGSSDYDRLSALGIEQAKLLGAYFHQTGVRFQKVVTGGHRRQQETAEAAAAHMAGMPTPVAMSAFDEFNTNAIMALLDDAGHSSGQDGGAFTAAYRSASEFRRAMESAIAVAIETPERLAPEYRLDGFVDRVREGITRVVNAAQPDSTIAIFTSGGTLAVLMQVALNISLSETVRLPWQIYNTSVSVFVHDGDRLDLQSFNTTPHLDRDSQGHLYTLL